MAKTSPILLTSADDLGRPLSRIDARPGGDITEGWLQTLLFRHPQLLPLDDFAEVGPAIPLAREVPTNTGRIDLLYVTPSGTLILVETKLWKNPDKHRSVVGQIIDYASQVATWDYDQLCQVVLTASRERGDADRVALEDKVRPTLAEVGADFTDFQEELSSNLTAGKFLLLIIGDRISENVAFMTKLLQSAPGLHFTLRLVEMKIYEQVQGSDWPIIVVPDVKAKTLEKERLVVRVTHTDERTHARVEESNEEQEAATPTGGALGIEPFLASLPRDLRPVYERSIEKWKALGGTLYSSPKMLFWKMDLAGAPRKVIASKPQRTQFVRRESFDEWSGNASLFEEYGRRLEASATLSQLFHAGKVFVRHNQVSPKDVEVLLDAAMRLAETIRKEEQEGK